MSVIDCEFVSLFPPRLIFSYILLIMAFGLFKGCLSQDPVATHNKEGKTDTTMRCDDSLSSNSSKSTLLESFAAKEQWDKVVKLVLGSQAYEWNLTTAQEDVLVATTPLHVALQYRAPVPVIDKLIGILKERLDVAVPEEVQDEQGRTPLHIAVTVGCEEAVAERLLAGDNLVMPAVSRDAQDRTPLHCATASPVVKQKKKSFLGANQMAMDTWNKRRVIALLIEHYPEACLLEDKDNKTPIDYARENKFSKHSVHELQRAADIWSPSMADSVEDSLANSDVPLVVPSVSGSTTGPALTPESIANLESLLQQDWESPEGDVSTIGDNEAELIFEDSECP